MTEKDNLGLPKLDKTGVLPDEATPYEQMPFPVVPEGKIMLAMDGEGNIFNLGVDPTLYVVDKPESE